QRRRRHILLALDDHGASMSTAALPRSVQLLDRDRDALADADAHGGERELAAALLHAVHGRQRQPRAAHAQRMSERDRTAMRVDEVGIFLDAELPKARDAL